MPSPTNIDRPLTLICPPRSGSSLMQMLFSEHPDCQTLGETANLVFSAWYGLTFSERVLVRQKHQANPEGYRESAGKAVREMLLSFSPSDKPYWMQKPIGTPEVVWLFGRPPDPEKFGAWYWQGMQAIFPNAKCFT